MPMRLTRVAVPKTSIWQLLIIPFFLVPMVIRAPQAAVVLKEDFENNLAGWIWTWPGPGIALSTDHAVSGSHSLKLHYTDLSTDVGYAVERFHTPLHHYFLQYYIRFSPGFVRSNISTKWLYGPRPPEGSPGPGCLVVQIGDQGPYFTCQGSKYDFPNGFYAIGFDKQNGYSVLPQVPNDKWILVQYEVDIGTLNKADGVMRYWLDGKLMGENTAVPLNVPGVQDFIIIAFYQERGLGDIYYDDVVLMDAPPAGLVGISKDRGDLTQSVGVNQPKIDIQMSGASVKFSLPLSEKYSLGVYDVTGREVWSHTGNGNVSWNHGGEIKRGVYMVRAKQGDNLLGSSFCNLR